MSFVDELKRRRVFRVAAVYAATAFVVWQAADIAIPALHLPDWLVTAVVTLTIIGFPVALVLAWAFDITPDGVQRTAGNTLHASAADMRWLPGRTIVLVALLLVIGGGVGWILKPGRVAPAASTAGARPTLAVLPFTNLGAPDDEYFADGVSDALRGSLAALGNIVVIASASSRAYRDTDKPASLIGRELGAHYLLTGTVRWARGSDGASRVQVSPELIVAESGTTHWQQPFDAVLSDVFVVQGEIATRVADALAVTLLETQRRELAARPTHDVAAWDAYLRASALQQQADLGAPLQRLAAEGFQRAVDIDPSFALAWASLARAHMAAYWFLEDHANARTRLADARVAVDRALALRPDLADAHLADAYYWYWGLRDYDRAHGALERARRRDPHHPQVLHILSAVLRRQGRFREAADVQVRVLELDPLNATNFREQAVTLLVTGDVSGAGHAAERAITLAPDAVANYVVRALVQHAQHRSDAAAETLCDGMRIIGSDRFASELTNRQWTRWVALDGAATWRMLETLPLTSQVVDTGSFQLYRAEWFRATGRNAVAAALADSALPSLERSATGASRGWWFHGQLALAHAFAGRHAAARSSLDRARAEAEAAPDAFDAPDFWLHAARVAVAMGDSDAAISHIERALAPPTRHSRAFLLADLRFAALRDDPRFLRLMRAR
jgi:TolB-like protein/tetratricopeptide (TPR) repeat protein